MQYLKVGFPIGIYMSSVSWNRKLIRSCKEDIRTLRKRLVSSTRSVIRDNCLQVPRHSLRGLVAQFVKDGLRICLDIQAA